MRKTSSCFCHRPLSPHPRRNRTGDDQRFFSRDCGIRMRELIDWSTAILAVESTQQDACGPHRLEACAPIADQWNT
jgi:hypothetical protein